MHANVRFGLFAGALSIGIVAQGCSAPPSDSSPHFVHAHAEIVGASSSAAKKAAVKVMEGTESSVQIVELNGFYQGCVDRDGPWSVAVTGSDIQLDNPPLMVVQDDVGCQLVATEVRADQLYEAAGPLPVNGGPSQSSSFTPLASDGGAAQVAFYASGFNTDPSFGTDFTLILFYSPGPNQTSTGTGATYTTNSAGLQALQAPAPDYTVDLSQMVIQTDANQMVVSASGPASLSLGGFPGSGYVIDDGTLPANPTFGQVDALYTSQPPMQLQWNGFAIDATALSLASNQLPVVRNIVIAGGWIGGVRSYQVISIIFEPATDLTPSAKRIQTVRK
jgi:hypothetical protein